MKKILTLYILCAAFLLTTGFGCKNFSELMPEPEVGYLSDNQAELIRSFAGLTNDDQSACELIYDSEDIPEVLCRILLEARKGSEIVFLVDKTGSMEDDIEEVKRNINDIIDCLPEGVRLGAATYGDYFADGDTWYDRTSLTEDYEEIRTYINAITVVGGGDYPESVYDAIWTTLDEMPWKDCKSPDKIIVMGDAEPQEGSLTNHTLEEVLAKAKSICDDTEFHPVIILDL